MTLFARVSPGHKERIIRALQSRNPVQILANNMLYDLGQTAIPTDAVDASQLRAPRAWDMKALQRFILLVGPCSSVFDVVTFLMMLFVFGCHDVSTPALAAHSQRLFQTGWFVESLVTQTFVIHVIRTDKVPFVESRSSAFLLGTSAAIVAVGVLLACSPLGRPLGFTSLPALYWPLLALIVACYLALTQAAKTFLLRRGWI